MYVLSSFVVARHVLQHRGGNAGLYARQDLRFLEISSVHNRSHVPKGFT